LGFLAFIPSEYVVILGGSRRATLGYGSKELSNLHNKKYSKAILVDVLLHQFRVKPELTLLAGVQNAWFNPEIPCECLQSDRCIGTPDNAQLQVGLRFSCQRRFIARPSRSMTSEEPVVADSIAFSPSYDPHKCMAITTGYSSTSGMFLLLFSITREPAFQSTSVPTKDESGNLFLRVISGGVCGQ
jgi:hypothetical protein